MSTNNIDINYLISIFKEFENFFQFMGNMSSHHKYDYEDDRWILSDDHLEGDVWTHTCLVFKEYIRMIYDKGEINVNNIYETIAILCHDLGKPLTRDDEGEKTTFYSHPFASIQLTIDFINYLKHKGYELGDNPYYYILNPVSNHIDFLRSDSKKHILYSNYDKELLRMNCTLCYCDSNGRITTKNRPTRDSELMKSIENIDNMETPPIKDYNNCFIFLCGVPASGKNWYIDNFYPNTPSVSYDDIRMDIYYDNFTSCGDKKEDYLNAYRYCTNNKIDLNSYLNKYVKYYIKNGYKTIIVNNTHLSKKKRRSLINLLGKNNYFKAVYIVRDVESMVESNKTRDDKNLPENVLHKFIYKQPIPTIEEGFDEIEFFDNYKLNGG